MAFHPGMATHPGMPPGQHMGPMGPHAAGAPMGHMQGQGMHPQMHPGMPGPNHVTQPGPMMAGIPPGMNPNANAMAHLQAAPQMFPNQQMQHLSQQHLIAQQQQQEQLARSKAIMSQRQGNPMGQMMQPGQSMNAQHFAQLQQQQQLRMNIPNMQQHNPMMAQMLQQQHQQQQQQQQAAGPNGPPQRQAGPPGGPNPAQMRMQPQMPVMHPQQPGPNAQGPGAAPQMRPQTSNQGIQMPQAQTPQSQAQQPPQRPQIPGRQPSHTSPQQNSQQDQQTPQSQPQQEHPVSAPGLQATIGNAQEGQNRTPQNPGQQVQNQQQQNQQPTNEMTKQMMNGPIQNQLQRNAVRQAGNAANSQMAQVSEMIAQGAKVRLVLFAEQLTSITSDKNNAPPLEVLQQIVADYFVDHGTFRFKMPGGANECSIPTATLARFFLTQYQNGVENIQMSIARSTTGDGPGGAQLIACEHAQFTYTYANDLFVRSRGKLRALLNPQHKFESLEFEMLPHDEFIHSAKIRQMFAANSPENQLKSPSMSKKQVPGKKGKAAQGRTIMLTENEVPPSPVRADGFTEGAFRFLETATVFAQMQTLFDYAQQNKMLSGAEAMQKFVNQNGHLAGQQMPPGFAQAQAVAAAQGNPQINFPGGMIPNGFPQDAGFPGMRPQPGMQGPFGASPAAGHLGLPNAMNSPHLRQGGSPGQVGLPPHMQGGPMAPQMAAQHSMQGTNSGAPNSNASPNAANKKRRASQIKLDGPNDSGGPPHVNGVTNPKQTPKMGNQQKRPRAS